MVVNQYHVIFWCNYLFMVGSIRSRFSTLTWRLLGGILHSVQKAKVQQCVINFNFNNTNLNVLECSKLLVTRSLSIIGAGTQVPNYNYLLE